MHIHDYVELEAMLHYTLIQWLANLHSYLELANMIAEQSINQQELRLQEARARLSIAASAEQQPGLNSELFKKEVLLRVFRTVE